jgi:hypothetical protein
MNQQQLVKIAKQHAIRPVGLKRPEIVRAIQRAENNFDCYASACHGECDQAECLWRDTCFADAHRMEMPADAR